MPRTRGTRGCKQKHCAYLKKFTMLVKFPDITITRDIADVNSRAGEGVRHRTWAMDRISGCKPKHNSVWSPHVHADTHPSPRQVGAVLPAARPSLSHQASTVI